ncbi:MAG TPA: DoxX family protein [Bryocella sp.]|nr:DoxX family protein [Bryocella sp.]
MKVLAIVCRILLGLVFVFFGGMGLFMHPNLPPRGTALGDFVNIFNQVGWSQAVAAFQVIGGLLVLFGGTVPFGLCILCPITVNILLFHILFHALAPSMIVAPIVVTILEIVLLYAYRGSFAGVWTTKATPTL